MFFCIPFYCKAASDHLYCMHASLPLSLVQSVCGCVWPYTPPLLGHGVSVPGAVLSCSRVYARVSLACFSTVQCIVCFCCVYMHVDCHMFVYVCEAVLVSLSVSLRVFECSVCISVCERISSRCLRCSSCGEVARRSAPCGPGGP